MPHRQEVQALEATALQGQRSDGGDNDMENMENTDRPQHSDGGDSDMENMENTDRPQHSDGGEETPFSPGRTPGRAGGAGHFHFGPGGAGGAQHLAGGAGHFGPTRLCEGSAGGPGGRPQNINIGPNSKKVSKQVSK